MVKLLAHEELPNMWRWRILLRQTRLFLIGCWMLLTSNAHGNTMHRHSKHHWPHSHCQDGAGFQRIVRLEGSSLQSLVHIVPPLPSGLFAKHWVDLLNKQEQS